MKCKHCYTKLTEEEQDYFKKYDYLHDMLEGYFCKKHSCECMIDDGDPVHTPWSWLIPCGICNENHVCKTCRWEAPSGLRICMSCHDKFNNH